MQCIRHHNVVKELKSSFGLVVIVVLGLPAAPGMCFYHYSIVCVFYVCFTTWTGLNVEDNLNL